MDDDEHEPRLRAVATWDWPRILRTESAVVVRQLDAEISKASACSSPRSIALRSQLAGTRTRLEEGFGLLTRELEDHAVPWLTRYAGIPALLAGLDRGQLEPRQTLGADPGWQAFHHAACLRYVGRQAEARARFAEVVAQHSDRPFPWVQERRAAAERQIAEL